MLSDPAPATRSSRGRNTETSAFCSMGPMAVFATRMRSSPSKAKGVVAKSNVAMPSVWRCLRSSPVAPPPVPPPSAVTTTAVRTPASAGSSSEGPSWPAARAAAAWPPLTLPGDQSLGDLHNDLFSFPDNKEVKKVRNLLDIVNTRPAADNKGILFSAISRPEWNT